MSKYVDTSAVIQVIGNIYLNPNLLDRDDKYFFNEHDFSEKFHRILFGSIYNLHLLGANKITVQSIEDYLSSRPEKYAIYKQNKGSEYLERISSNVQLSTFDYYYQRIKKMTLLRMYENIGLDLSWIYDANNILDVKKKQKQEDWLDNSSLDEIADIIDNKMTQVRMSYVDNNESGGSVQAGEGALTLLELFKETPDIGCPLYGNIINTILRGARLKKFYIRSAATGVGKALANNTKIPTPEGWRKVQDIKIGDYLFGKDGTPTQVLAVYPQKKRKQIYQVKLTDNRIINCCEDHLWSYYYSSKTNGKNDDRKIRTETTKDIIKRIANSNNQSYQTNDGGYRIKLPLNEPVQYNPKEYYLSPYVMGALIGDGSFRYSKNQKALSFSSADEEIVKIIAAEMGWTYKKNSEFNYNWTFENPIDTDTDHLNVWVEEALKEYPELWNLKSENKFIPQQYLLGSVEQRFKLLQGLLDTDGGIDNKGRITFTTTSKKLRNDIIELCCSLGLIANFLEDKRTDKYTKTCYQINIQTKKEIKPQCFRLERKHKIAIEYCNSKKRAEKKDYIAIKNISILNEYTDMTCFTVDALDSLFLAGNYIVTHNTRSMIADCCFLSCNEIYNPVLKKWEVNGTQEPSIYITTEQEVSEIQTMMIAFISGLNEDIIRLGAYRNQEEWERVVKAAKILEKSPLYIEELLDFSLRDIENSIKRNIYDKNVRYVFFDYIQSSLKILSEVSSSSKVRGLREDNVLFMISAKLKDFCNKYGIFILTATQLNDEYKRAKIYDQSLLRGAKAIADRADAGLILLEADEDDKEALSEIVQKGGFAMPDIKMSIYKNRGGRYKNVLLWCSSDRGTCRINPLFVTQYDYELIKIEDYKINVVN